MEKDFNYFLKIPYHAHVSSKEQHGASSQNCTSTIKAKSDHCSPMHSYTSSHVTIHTLKNASISKIQKVSPWATGAVAGYYVPAYVNAISPYSYAAQKMSVNRASILVLFILLFIILRWYRLRKNS